MTDEEYRKNREWADMRLNDAAWVLERACGWITKPANEFLDKNCATDLITQNGTMIAVRSRDFDEYFTRYPYEFTLRSKLPSGEETELPKVRKGLVRYGFYGFCQGTEHRFFRIIDFEIFNIAVDGFGLDKFSVEKRNKNDGSWFRAFDVRKFNRLGLSIHYKYGWC